MSAKHLVLAGGGHAHMQAILDLPDYTAKGHRVTLIGPSPYHYYSGMGPGLLSGVYEPQQTRINVRKMAENRGATFVEGKARRVDPANRTLHLESGETVHYDVVSFNLGSEVLSDSLLSNPDGRILTVKPIQNLVRAQRIVLEEMKRRTPEVLVIGGGASGVEIAGNLRQLVNRKRGKAHITLVAGSRLLKRFPEKAARLARDALTTGNIEIIEEQSVQSLEHGTAILGDGNRLPYDLAILATGVQPAPIFRNSNIPTAEDGSLLVNDCLQSVAYPEIFGGGDCITVKGLFLDRVGVYAVRQGPILRDNIMCALEGGELRKFDPGNVYLLILNLGDRTGLLVRQPWILRGRLAFILKDFLDRWFMSKLQISGEDEEDFAL